MAVETLSCREGRSARGIRPWSGGGIVRVDGIRCRWSLGRQRLGDFRGGGHLGGQSKGMAPPRDAKRNAAWSSFRLPDFGRWSCEP